MNKISTDKPKIAMDISTLGKGGGPYTSTKRIMNSSLKEEFSFHEIVYDPRIGRGISLTRILDLRRQILRIQPDIVHYTGLQLSGFHMAIACWLAGVRRTVMTIRGSSSDAIEFSSVKRFMLSTILEPLTIVLSKKIVGVSDFVTTSKVSKIFSKKIFGTIYNFPPIQKGSMEKSELTREKLGFTKDDIVLVTIGRVNREKGLHILESAIIKIGLDNNLKFLVVGDGDYLDQMKTNLAEQVHKGQVVFLGYIEDVYWVNKISDIFVLPTLHETLSNALLEASIAPLPLIASNTGGVPEIVETGFNGILFETGNDLELIDAIQTLANDSELRLLYATNAFNKIKIKFSKISIEKKIRELYLETLKMKG